MKNIRIIFNLILQCNIYLNGISNEVKKRYNANFNLQPFMDFDKTVQAQWNKLHIPTVQNALVSL